MSQSWLGPLLGMLMGLLTIGLTVYMLDVKAHIWSSPPTGFLGLLAAGKKESGHRPPFWRDWLAFTVAVLVLGALMAVARALGIEYVRCPQSSARLTNPCPLPQRLVHDPLICKSQRIEKGRHHHRPPIRHTQRTLAAPSSYAAQYAGLSRLS